MRKQFTIIFALLLLLAVTILMVKDLFIDKETNQENPYEYNLDDFKKVDESLISHVEIKQIPIDSERIFAITIDEKDRLYVATFNSVFVYNSSFELIREIPTGKSISINVFNENIYLGKKDNIEIWNEKAEKLAEWKSPNEIATFTSIAVDNHFVFVADAANKVVYKYNHKGELLSEIGKKNVEAGIKGFIIPSPYFDLLIGREGELWVVNPGRHAFEAYRTDGSLISSWEKTSMQLEGFSGCCNPSNIAMLSDGSFVTSEKGIERVKIHAPHGEFKSVVATPADFDEATKGIDLAVDSNDRIFVMDPKRKLIRVFVKK